VILWFEDSCSSRNGRHVLSNPAFVHLFGDLVKFFFFFFFLPRLA
jgi:hypothetical protein